MPPKVKITRKDIIKASIELIRKNGAGAINARSVAAAIGCSTQPIFSNFASMEDLEESVIASAHECYLGFIENEVGGEKYPRYKAFGMAYIRFAKEEKELFKLLFMRDRSGKETTPTDDYTKSVEMIMKSNSLSQKDAELFHLEMWATVHGIASMSATAFCELPTELISDILSDVYSGLCSRFTKE